MPWFEPLPSPAETEALRASTYRPRGLLLAVSAVLILAAHAIDRAQSGGPAWTALGLRLAWAATLLLATWGLLRWGPLGIRTTGVVAALGAPLLFHGILEATGGAGSPVFAFVYVLVLLIPAALFDYPFMAALASGLGLVSSALLLWRDGAGRAAWLAWLSMGPTSFAFGIGLGQIIQRTLLARKRFEKEQREARQQLEEALAKVKALSGLLPICSFCKKIRNEAGDWEQLEGYLAGHSEAEFSHSFCPTCLRVHFPEQEE